MRRLLISTQCTEPENKSTLKNYLNLQHWLDPNTRLARQLKGIKEPYELYFGVKFYAADPCKLAEEITR